MKRSWWYRFVFLLVVASISALMVIPTALNFNEETSFPFKSKINLGLDLQGGLYMILGIDFNRVYLDEAKNYGRKISDILTDEGIKNEVGSIDKTLADDPRTEILLQSETDLEKAKEKVRSFFGSYLRLTNEGGNKIQYGLSKVNKTEIETQAVSKSIEVIRNRIDEFGVTEPEIISQGNDRIIIQLPGVKDIDRAKELIGKTAKLSFNIVNDNIGAATLNGWVKKAEAAGIVYKKGQRFSDYLTDMNDHLAKELPKGFQLAFEKKVSKLTNELESKIPYLVESVSKLSGDGLQDARVQIDQQKNEPYVSLTFKSAGAKLFEQLTGENVGKRMAIVLDGNVYSAPVIQTKIGGGRAQITLGSGGFNRVLKEARDLALVLRAGALPVQLDFLEQRTVGPSLGEDSIIKARYAAIIGSILV
ncbi:MAG: hypothetical protein HN509_11440, partial [Halobacteriovoraceae bacterium]|nr:hypothetical protein [Halobacteriovoraceae bacterium]